MFFLSFLIFFLRNFDSHSWQVDEWIVFASYGSLLMIQLDITPRRYLRLPRLKLLRLAQGSDIAFSYAIRLAGTTVVLGSVLHT